MSDEPISEREHEIRALANDCSGMEPANVFDLVFVLDELARLRTQVVHLEAQRDQLQAANTAEVERRRKAETQLSRCRAALDLMCGAFNELCRSFGGVET